MRVCGLLVLAFLGALTGLFTGCGGDSLGRKAISGNVTFDGAPVERGNISFQPVEQTALATSSGATITGGKYSVPQEHGLTPGKYRVTISAPKPGTGGVADENAPPGDPPPAPQEMIPPEWNTNSNQTIEVKAEGPFEFNFEIKSKGK